MCTERTSIATIFGHQESADQFGTEEGTIVKGRAGSLAWLRKYIEDADCDSKRHLRMIDGMARAMSSKRD